MKNSSLFRGLCILCSFLAISCFRIRNVEAPQVSTSDWVSPTDYEILLSNFQTAISQTNVQNYLRCFNRDEFDFVPVANLFNDNEAVWLSWTVQEEQTYLENAFLNLTVNTGQSLILQEEDLQDVTADSVKYVGSYTLRVNHTDTTLTTLFTGQMQLSIKRNTFNEWEIHRWTDIELAQDSSWSNLKLRFVQ